MVYVTVLLGCAIWLIALFNASSLQFQCHFLFTLASNHTFFIETEVLCIANGIKRCSEKTCLDKTLHFQAACLQIPARNINYNMAWHVYESQVQTSLRFHGILCMHHTMFNQQVVGAMLNL